MLSTSFKHPENSSIIDLTTNTMNVAHTSESFIHCAMHYFFDKPFKNKLVSRIHNVWARDTEEPFPH